MTERSIISNYISQQHRRASRALGYALILGDSDGWNAASSVWTARLTTAERAALAFASLTALDPEQREMAAEAALGGAGPPSAAFLSDMDQAVWWADIASEGERRAYCLASFNRLTPEDRAAFLMHLRKAA